MSTFDFAGLLEFLMGIFNALKEFYAMITK